MFTMLSHTVRKQSLHDPAVTSLWHHRDITVTSSQHPALRWTCCWVKWPTALILHIKLSIKNKKKKKKGQRRRRRRRSHHDNTSPLWLDRNWSSRGRKSMDDGRRRGRRHMMTFSFYIPSSQHQCEGGWMDEMEGNLFPSLATQVDNVKKSSAVFPILPSNQISEQMEV